VAANVHLQIRYFNMRIYILFLYTILVFVFTSAYFILIPGKAPILPAKIKLHLKILEGKTLIA